jgi:GNAT superfamily N-acetyltransferase
MAFDVAAERVGAPPDARRRGRDILSGAAAAWRVLSSGLLQRRSERIFSKMLTPAAHPPGAADLRAVVIAAPSARLLRALPAMWRKQVAFTARFRRYLDARIGCVLICEDDAIVGCAWFTRRATAIEHHPRLLRLGVDLRDDDAFVFDLRMLPAHRNRGAAGLLLVEEEMRGHGFRRALLCLPAHDRRALAQCADLGWGEVRTVRSWLVADRVLVSRVGVFVRNRAGRRLADFSSGPAWLVTPRVRPPLSSAATAESRS